MLFCDGFETCDLVFDCQTEPDPCDDGLGCTVDVCDDLGDFCTNTPDDTLCDNGLFCDGAETCDFLLDCQLGTLPCDDGIGCTDDVCDDILDACTNTPNDANCDDGLFCTGVATCDAIIRLYEQCDKFPHQVREALFKAASQWRRAAETGGEAGRVALSESCKAGLPGVTQAMKAVGCEPPDLEQRATQ